MTPTFRLAASINYRVKNVPFINHRVSPPITPTTPGSLFDSHIIKPCGWRAGWPPRQFLPAAVMCGRLITDHDRQSSGQLEKITSAQF